jgi:hypothetical protein
MEPPQIIQRAIFYSMRRPSDSTLAGLLSRLDSYSFEKRATPTLPSVPLRAKTIDDYFGSKRKPKPL